MSQTSNFDQEIAETRVYQEVAASMRQSSKAVSGPGTDICIDCDEPIEPQRRAAAPFAKRCIVCQQAAELR